MTQFFDRPWDSQPQEAADPWVDGIGSGLIVAVNPSSGARNLVPGGPVVSVNGAPSVGAVNASGRAVGGFSSSAYLSFTNPLGPNAPATIFMVCQNTSTGDQGFNTFCNSALTGAQEHIPFGDLLYLSSLAASRYVSAVAVPGGVASLLRPFSVAYTRGVGVSGVSYPPIAAYINNSLVGSTTSTSGAAQGATFRIGSNSQSTLAYIGGVALFAMWSRELSRDELARLHANPWQLFQPRRIYIPTSAAAGGNASVTLPSAAATSAAGTISATGGAAVTLTGAAATASAGTLTATGGATAAITGASTTAAAGPLTATGGAVVALVGASATAAAGIISASASGSASVTLPSALATAAAGEISATGGATVTLPGAAAVAAAGDITVSLAGDVSVTLPSASATASAGTISATGGAVVVLTGAGATAYAGTISATGDVVPASEYIRLFSRITPAVALLSPICPTVARSSPVAMRRDLRSSIDLESP